MEEKLNGIVLGGVNYGENDRIISIFTVERGTVSAKIKGVKKAGAKLKFASEPFCFAEFVLFKNGDKRTIKTASLHDSYYPLRENIVKYYSAGTVIEFIKKFQKEEIVSPELFILTADTLKELAYGDDLPKFVVAKFLYKALKISGYGINFADCANCGGDVSARPFFDADAGSFFCEECRGQYSREIKISTYFQLKDLESGKKTFDVYDGVLKLLDYYVGVKTDEKLFALKELIKL